MKYTPDQLLATLQNVYAQKAFDKSLEIIMTRKDITDINEIWKEEFFEEIQDMAQKVITGYLKATGLEYLGYKCEIKIISDEPGAFSLKVWQPNIILN